MQANTPSMFFPIPGPGNGDYSSVANTGVSTPPSSGLPPPAYSATADFCATASSNFGSNTFLPPVMTSPSFSNPSLAAASGRGGSVASTGSGTYPFLNSPPAPNLQPGSGVFFPSLGGPAAGTPNIAAAAAATGLTPQQLQTLNAQIAAQAQAQAQAAGQGSVYGLPGSLASLGPGFSTAAMASAAAGFLPPGSFTPAAAVGIPPPSFGGVDFGVGGNTYAGPAYYFNPDAQAFPGGPVPMLRGGRGMPGLGGVIGGRGMVGGGGGPSLTAVANPKNSYGQAVLFVGQLNYEVTESDVLQLFSYYGQVHNVVLLKDATRSKRKKVPSGPGGSTAEVTGDHAGAPAPEEKRVVGSSAFVTYGSTDEADLAIICLHNKYCMDNRDKPLQVSYCQKTEVISEYGYQHARILHDINPANPLPAVLPRSITAPPPQPTSPEQAVGVAAHEPPTPSGQAEAAAPSAKTAVTSSGTLEKSAGEKTRVSDSAILQMIE